MKKLNHLLLTGFVGASLLFSSCSTEKFAGNQTYPTLGIAQQSPEVNSNGTEKMAAADVQAPVLVADAGRETAKLLTRSEQKLVTPTVKQQLREEVRQVKETENTKAEKQKMPVKKAGIFSKKEAKDGDKSWIVAMLLAFFLGGFGIHRFYLGYTGIGIIQLAMLLVGSLLSLFIIGIPILIALYIWVLIDFIRIIIKNLEPKNGSYTD